MENKWPELTQETIDEERQALGLTKEQMQEHIIDCRRAVYYDIPEQREVLVELGRLVALSNRVDEAFVVLVAKMMSGPVSLTRCFTSEMSSRAIRTACLSVARELCKLENPSEMAARLNAKMDSLEQIVKSGSALEDDRNTLVHSIYGGWEKGMERTKWTAKMKKGLVKQNESITPEYINELCNRSVIMFERITVFRLRVIDGDTTKFASYRPPKR